MSTAAIRASLEGTLKAYADAQVPKIPVSFENCSFTKPTGVPFLECFLLPSETINPTIEGKRKREIGLFQINCWYPDGLGTGDATALAQAIVDLFPVVPKGVVSVEKTPRVEKGIPEDSGWFIIPVVISYRYES